MWIYNRKNWPCFRWDKCGLAPLLEKLRYQQGKCLGRMSQLGFKLQKEACVEVLTQDVVQSSALEGEHLNLAHTRSSVARRLGFNVAGQSRLKPANEGLVRVALDATQNFNHVLNKKRLCAWHAELFPSVRGSNFRVGRWRDDKLGPMQVVSGSVGREKVHFQAPPAHRLPGEMKVFFEYLKKAPRQDLIQSGVAHLWFVTLHPFGDGNGRLARVISDLMLARCENMSQRFYSVSRQIEIERKQYYAQLEKQQRGGLDISLWLEWFLGCVQRAVQNSEQVLERVLLKARVWELLKSRPVNARHRRVLDRMLSDGFEGFIHTAKYARMVKCSKDTALRDIQHLVAWGILVPNSARGRSTSYRVKLRKV